MNTHTRKLRRHFDKRSGERMGFLISSAHHDAIIAMIQRGGGTCIRRSSNNRTVWSVDIEGKPHTVVYDKKRKVLVTVWPDEIGEVIG